MDWYLKVLRNYVGFGGRARRKEYWMFVLVNFVLIMVLGIVDKILGWEREGGEGILTTILWCVSSAAIMGRTVSSSSRHRSFGVVAAVAVDPAYRLDRDFDFQLSERNAGRKPLWSGS
jgi:Predicted membrane protein